MFTYMPTYILITFVTYLAQPQYIQNVYLTCLKYNIVGWKHGNLDLKIWQFSTKTQENRLESFLCFILKKLMLTLSLW
jgi:hypothetical protein